MTKKEQVNNIDFRAIQKMSREDLEFAYLGSKSRVKEAIECIQLSKEYIILEAMGTEKQSILYDVLKILGGNE